MPRFTSRPTLLKVLLALAVLLPLAALLHRYLPQHDVVRLVGTEVRRVDLDGKPGGDTYDVYYIYAETIESRQPRVYRNQDTGWGLPPYFKFNSADVQAVASSIAADKGTAVVTHYGWRINLFSMFPNATTIRRAAADASPFPWFNVVFLVALSAGAVLFVRSGRRLLSRRQA